MRPPLVGEPSVFGNIRHNFFSEVYNNLSSLVSDALDGYSAIVPVVGPTRVGKSQVIASVLSNAPAPQTLTDLGGLPFVYMRCPTRPTTTSLPEMALLAMSLSKFSKKTSDEITRHLIRHLKRARTRVLVIDEIQHCIEAGSRMGDRTIGDWIKNLQADLGIVVILVGLPSALEIFRRNEQLDERGLAPIYFNPYRWLIPEEEDGFGAAVVSYMEALEELGIHLNIDYEQLVTGMYAISGGRIGLLNKFFSELRRRKEGTLTPKDLNGVFEKTSCVRRPCKLPFSEKGFSDQELLAAYFRVMNEAGIPMVQNTPDEAVAMELADIG